MHLLLLSIIASAQCINGCHHKKVKAGTILTLNVMGHMVVLSSAVNHNCLNTKTHGQPQNVFS